MSDIKPLIKRDFYAIITNASGDKVLLMEDNERWGLPHWEASKAFNPSVFAPWVIQTMRECYGLETILLKEYYFRRIFENNEFRGTHRVVLLELQGGSTDLGWYGPEAIAHHEFAVPLHAELVHRWLHENSIGPIPPLRMAWARPGWFEKARDWVTNFVGRQGWQLTGPIEQRKADVISAQLKIPTSVGNLYLKAIPPYFKKEPVFAVVLEKLLPDKVPHILGSDAEDGWILMSDFKGETLAEVKDFAVWEAALREYARLQIGCVEHTEELLQAGARDRRLSVLGEQLEKVLERDDLWLVGQAMGLSQAEVNQLHAAIPRLQAICLELAAFGLPETLDSGDFHAHNVALTSNGFVFYDWSDLTVSHPFVSLNPFVEYSANFEDRPDYWERLTKAYLEPWQVFLPQSELDCAYRLAYILGSVVQVLNYTWIRDNIEPEDYTNVDGGFIHYARMLLEALGKSSENH